MIGAPPMKLLKIMAVGALALIGLFLVIDVFYGRGGAIIGTIAAFGAIALVVGYIDRRDRAIWKD